MKRYGMKKGGRDCWKRAMIASVCTCFLLFSQHLAYGQVTVSGRVLSAVDSLPITGVKLSSGEGTQKVQSDRNGYFTLRGLSIGDRIVTDALGYAHTSMTIAHSDTTVSIYMQEAMHSIDEVIVNTGYQSLPKERATGSFVQIDSALLNNRITTNILERLDGIAPGLQYDNRSQTAPMINIRGINTFSTALMQPLIVVDNFPFEGDISNINPNDVASVTLLKDAAATSIWGVRAGNGVIVINLKKPKEGQPLRVGVTANTTIGQKPDLYYDQRMDASDFIDVELMLYERDFFDNALNGAVANRTVFSPVVHLLHQVEQGQVNASDAMATIAEYRSRDYRDDMMAYFYRPSVNQQYHGHLSGGGRSHSYRIAVGHDRNESNRMANGLRRTTIRAGSDIRPFEGLQISTVLAYVQTNTRNAGSGATVYPINPAGGRTSLYPYASFVNEEGAAEAIPYLYNYQFVDGLSSSPLLDWKMRPLDELGHNAITNRGSHVTANINLAYDLMNGFRAEALYAFERQQDLSQTHYGEASFYARNQINRFSQVNGETVTRIVPLGGIKNSTNTDMESHRGRVQLGYDKLLGEKHSVTAFVGSELLHRPTHTNSFRAYGYNEHLLTSQQVDYVNAYPIYGGLAGNSRVEPFGGFGLGLRRFVSLYGNGAYTYDRRYTVSFSARRDASNLFGVATNERWNPLWSTGFAWMATQEPFLTDLYWLNLLKFRATYGHSGNSGGVAGTLPIISYLSPSSLWTSNLPRALVSTLPNPHLRWENVRMINYAIDFSLFNGRLGGTFEYYTKKSSDLLTEDALDPTTGFSSVRRNVGEARGRGFDLQVDTRNLVGRVQWDSKLIFSKNRDRVTQYYGSELTSLNYTMYSGSSLRPTLDRALYPVFSYRFAGLDGSNGNPQGYLDGELSTDYTTLLADSLQNLNYHGTALPPYYGSIQQVFRWKQLELFFNITYKFGHFFQRETIRYQSLFNNWESHSDFERRWQSPGDELSTTVPSMVYPANAARDNFYAYSEANIDRGDLIRLQDIRLAYAVRNNWLGRNLPIQVNVNVNNVGLLWTRTASSLDPDYYELPPPRTITIGLSASL